MQQPRIKLDPNIAVSELTEKYPILVEILATEYEFHCATCIFSDYDSLIEGAAIHGIEGVFFEEMLEHLEQIVNDTYNV